MTDDSTQQKIAELIEQLRAPLNVGWYEAAQALHALGTQSVAPLIEALKDPELRANAISALKLFGPDAAPAIEAVIPFLSADTPEDEPAYEAMGLFAMIGEPAVAPLVARLGQSESSEYARTRRALCDIGAETVAPALIDCLNSPNAVVRRRACQLLERMGHGSHDATPELIKCLGDGDSVVRREAARALSDCKPALLIEAFDNGDALTRAGCIESLTMSRQFVSPDNLAFFGTALHDADPLVRLAAADGLVKFSSRLACASLGKAVTCDDALVQLEALQLIQRHATKMPVDGLSYDVRRLLSHTDDSVQREAALTVAANGWIRGDAEKQEVHKILWFALRDENNPRRYQFIQSIKKDWAIAELLAPVLVDLLQDSNTEVAALAADRLGAIRVSTDPVIEGLTAALDSPVFDVRHAAIYALGDLGPAAAGALPKFVQFLRAEVHIDAVLRALEGFGPAAEPALDDVARIIGRRTEIAPYVLASIGTRAAILELCDAVESYGNGDRKDFDASQGALRQMTKTARPLLETEFASAKPGQYTKLLAGLCTILEPADALPFLLQVLDKGNERDRYSALVHLNWSSMAPLIVSDHNAFERLLAMLKDKNASLRVEALEIFATVYREFPSFVDAYRDQLKVCYTRTAADVATDYERNDLSRAAETLELL